MAAGVNKNSMIGTVIIVIILLIIGMFRNTEDSDGAHLLSLAWTGLAMLELAWPGLATPSPAWPGQALPHLARPDLANTGQA